MKTLLRALAFLCPRPAGSRFAFIRTPLQTACAALVPFCFFPHANFHRLISVP